MLVNIYDMEKSTKMFLGKILGEIFRLQRSNNSIRCFASDAQIYALLHGFEGVIDEIFDQVGYISPEQFETVRKMLEEIWVDENKLSNFKGFYDIEHDLQTKGVGRGEALKILKYFKANEEYIEVINKMDSSNSPCECRTFDLKEWDI